jgi:hypothetical protein
MGRIVTAADAIRDATSAHFSFVHHTGKDAARGARGHSLLRAATDTEIEATTGAVTVTKQRDMESDFALGFQLCDISIGEDPNGAPIKSAIVEWKSEATKPSKAEPSKRVPAGLRLLMDVVAFALDENGAELRPIGTAGPQVRAVADSHIRDLYFAKVAEKAAPDEDECKLYDRQLKAFNRSLKSAIDAKTLIAGDHKGERFVWQP